MLGNVKKGKSQNSSKRTSPSRRSKAASPRISNAPSVLDGSRYHVSSQRTKTALFDQFQSGDGVESDFCVFSDQTTDPLLTALSQSSLLPGKAQNYTDMPNSLPSVLADPSSELVTNVMTEPSILEEIVISGWDGGGSDLELSHLSDLENDPVTPRPALSGYLVPEEPYDPGLQGGYYYTSSDEVDAFSESPLYKYNTSDQRGQRDELMDVVDYELTTWDRIKTLMTIMMSKFESKYVFSQWKAASYGEKRVRQGVWLWLAMGWLKIFVATLSSFNLGRMIVFQKHWRALDYFTLLFTVLFGFAQGLADINMFMFIEKDDYVQVNRVANFRSYYDAQQIGKEYNSNNRDDNVLDLIQDSTDFIKYSNVWGSIGIKRARMHLHLNFWWIIGGFISTLSGVIYLLAIKQDSVASLSLVGIIIPFLVFVPLAYLVKDIQGRLYMCTFEICQRATVVPQIRAWKNWKKAEMALCATRQDSMNSQESVDNGDVYNQQSFEERYASPYKSPMGQPSYSHNTSARSSSSEDYSPLPTSNAVESYSGMRSWKPPQ